MKPGQLTTVLLEEKEAAGKPSYMMPDRVATRSWYGVRPARAHRDRPELPFKGEEG